MFFQRLSSVVVSFNVMSEYDHPQAAEKMGKEFRCGNRHGNKTALDKLLRQILKLGFVNSLGDLVGLSHNLSKKILFIIIK